VVKRALSFSLVLLCKSTTDTAPLLTFHIPTTPHPLLPPSRFRASSLPRLIFLRMPLKS